MDLFLLVDNHTRITYCGGSGPNLFGVALEELVGQPLLDLIDQALPGPEQANLRETFTEVVTGAVDSVKSIEVRCTDPPFKEYRVTVFPSPVSETGSMTGITIKDVTVEKEIEARRDTFLAVLSHELRDPITAMMGFTRLLLNTPVLDHRERYWLENVQTCGQRLTAIAKDMLDVAALRGGNLSLNLEEVKLKDVVCEVLPLVRESYPELACTSLVSNDLPNVVADRVRLAQILNNLLSNAAKYTVDGGQVLISAGYQERSERVVLAVTDQGIGIPPDDLESIFQPFQRSLRPETQGIRGAGLGLYIVDGLVKMMNGQVSVESELGKGSTFEVSLPTSSGTTAAGADHIHPSSN